VGSPFGWGKFRTPISAITIEHSLFPASVACTAILLPYGRPTPQSTDSKPRWREIQVYHVPHDSQIVRVRASLCTDWVNKCVGLPSILTDLPSIAILALGPKGGSSPALVTIRNSKTSLTLSIPNILQEADSVPLTAASLTECLRPPRCRRRILG